MSLWCIIRNKLVIIIYYILFNMLRIHGHIRAYWQTLFLAVDWHNLSEQSLLVKLQQSPYETLEIDV